MILITNLITNLISILIVLILVFYCKVSSSSALSNVDWFLLKENQDGKEWLDLGSLKKFKNDEISVLTKFYENPKIKNEKGKTTLYVMRINCITNQFKDTSIDGFPTLNSNWQDSNDDELIDVVIDKACNEV